MQSHNVTASRLDDARPLNLVLRREIARCLMPSATTGDLTDCADLARALGEDGIDEALRRVTCLLQGATRKRSPHASSARFTTDTAIEELRSLMAADADAASAAPGSSPPGASSGDDDPGPHLVTLFGKIAAAIDNGDVEPFSRHMSEAEPIADRMASLASDASSLSLIELAAVVVGRHLASFRSNHHILYTSPFGSPALLMASAHLPQGSLGPYLSGVERLIRKPSDLFGMVGLAARDRSGVDQERWVVLLASKLGQDGRRDLIGQMATRRMASGLRGMLHIERCRLDASHDNLCLVRDMAIDMADLPLAIEAQLTVVERQPYSAVQQIIVAELYGTSGQVEQARDALKAALEMEPKNRAALARMEALVTDRFQRYHANRGYGRTYGRNLSI